MKTCVMKFWWVNHKQTHTSEIDGGYIWSPKKESNGARSQFYVNLTLVEPGDIVFSYANAKIMAIGVATGSYKEQVKPAEFGSNGMNWSNIGWLVTIEWRRLQKTFSPKTYIDDIAPLLPNGYSPITQSGNGNQKCYLAQILKPLADLLFSISATQNSSVLIEINDLKIDIKTDIEVQEVIRDEIEFTEKEQLIKARLGQGLFRKRLVEIEAKCRLTQITNEQFLVASHIKPWRDGNNVERLDGNNGLLLSPHVDRLFDRGWISFNDDGTLLISNNDTKEVMASWGLNSNINVGSFSDKQKPYLAYHRTHVYKAELVPNCW